MHRWFSSGLRRLFGRPVRYAMVGDWQSALMDGFPADRRVNCIVGALRLAVAHCLSTCSKSSELLARCRSSGEPTQDQIDAEWIDELALVRSTLQRLDSGSAEADRPAVQKDRLEDLVSFLAMVESACVELADGTRPTVNLVLAWLRRLQAFCAPTEADSGFLCELKRTLAVSLEIKVNPTLCRMHFVAAYLDYRLKNERFAFEGNRLRTKEAKQFVRELCDELADEGVGHRSNAALANDPFLPDELNSHAAELRGYEADSWRLHELYDGDRFDALRYWQNQREQLPTLSRIAFWVMSVPASSALSGRSSPALDP